MQQKLQYEEQNTKVVELMDRLQSDAAEKGIALTQVIIILDEFLVILYILLFFMEK